MRRFLPAFCFFVFCFAFFSNSVFAEYKQVFRISAYYSPLPCQERYVTGSYETDIRLNGRGTNGADGTPVYPGMIAAPKSYPFGTKMFIQGVGMTTVHDRGGAIVSSANYSGEYDRLDIWMGYGDAGLTRALNWGKRNVEVTVYGVVPSMNDDIVLPGYSSGESAVNQCSPDYVGGGDLKVEFNTYNQHIVDEKKAELKEIEDLGVEISGLFSKGLMRGDTGADVKKLQIELANLNFYKADFSGVFDELTFHALFKFQQSQGLVNSLDDVGAGYFGPRTRARLNEIITMRNESRIAIAKANQNSNIASKDPIKISTELSFGEKSAEVKKLQDFLITEGVYVGSFTSNYFGELTKASVVEFQKKHGIIASENDIGAGRVGPKTLNVINSLI